MENQSERDVTSSNSGSSPGTGNRASPNRGPSRTSIVLTVISIGLLVALVWWVNPRPAGFKPAPLEPMSNACSTPPRAFVPSNLIDIPAPIMSTLSEEAKRRVVRRVNTEMCPCGCKMSVATCLPENPDCEAAKSRFKEIVDEEKNRTAKVEAKK